MTYIFEAACPLCGSPAKFKGLHFGLQKHFECPTCVEFIIEAAAEKRLQEMPREFRDKLSERANGSDATSTWVIRLPTHEELSKNPKLTMRGEFVGDGFVAGSLPD